MAGISGYIQNNYFRPWQIYRQPGFLSKIESLVTVLSYLLIIPPLFIVFAIGVNTIWFYKKPENYNNQDEKIDSLFQNINKNENIKNEVIYKGTNHEESNLYLCNKCKKPVSTEEEDFFPYESGNIDYPFDLISDNDAMVKELIKNNCPQANYLFLTFTSSRSLSNKTIKDTCLPSVKKKLKDSVNEHLPLFIIAFCSTSESDQLMIKTVKETMLTEFEEYPCLILCREKSGNKNSNFKILNLSEFNTHAIRKIKENKSLIEINEI